MSYEETVKQNEKLFFRKCQYVQRMQLKSDDWKNRVIVSQGFDETIDN